MRVRVWCRREKCIGFEMLTPSRREAKCPLCGDALLIAPPPDAGDDTVVEKCWRCECPNLYLEKSFPMPLGCLVIAVSAALAIAFARETFGLSFLGIIVLDFILYFMVPTRAVCYQCSAEYMGTPRNPRHKGHDLLIAGKYADREDVGGPVGH
jgi:hypothetical protein